MGRALQSVLEDFATRHRDIHAILEANYERVSAYVKDPNSLSEDQKLLLGAYFTSEYSVESAALFQPLHRCPSGPGRAQSGLSALHLEPPGHGGRAYFRRWSSAAASSTHETAIALDSVGPYVERAEVELNPSYDRHTFRLKLEELGVDNSFVQEAFASLPDRFSLVQLRTGIEGVTRGNPASLMLRESMAVIDWIAESNYTARFRPQSTISERVLFPVAHQESKGMEDARFVCFTDEDGESHYFATYTASDGHTILPMLLRTTDFLSFTMCSLNGPAVKDKDLALFPRR